MFRDDEYRAEGRPFNRIKGKRPRKETILQALVSDEDRENRDTPFMKTVEYFIWPLVETFLNNSPTSTLEDALDFIFHTGDRKIIHCKAKEGFRLTGNLWRGAQHYDPISGDRYVHHGHRVLVRFDRKQPRFVEIQYRDQMFKLTRKQFEEISPFLDEEEGSSLNKKRR